MALGRFAAFPALLAALTAMPALVALGAAPVAAATLERVKETGSIRIGYRPDARPHSFRDASGRPAGYVIDLCGEVVQDIRKLLGTSGIRIDYVEVSAADRFLAVRDGRIDLLCEASSMTMARREIVDFSMPTFVDGAGVLSKIGRPVQSFADLSGMRVGVLGGTTTEQVLRDALGSRNIANTVHAVDSHHQGAALVAKGEIDAYVADRSILMLLSAGRQLPPDLTLSPRYFSYETFGIALPRGDSEFRMLVDRAIARLSRSGHMESLLQKAMGADPDELLRMLIAINAVPE